MTDVFLKKKKKKKKSLEQTLIEGRPHEFTGRRPRDLKRN